ALGADRYVSLTDVDGIRDDSGEALRGLDANAARQMIGRGVIYGGMIPKVDACIRALAATREAQIVDGRQPHVLIRALLDPASVGTLLTPSA
ncbi:MAG: acetylglutamate kinase, partial [Chloroflexota bacterium]|nr:acetylglutamate kinase [Chloroflexota bacterium]